MIESRARSLLETFEACWKLAIPFTVVARGLVALGACWNPRFEAGWKLVLPLAAMLSVAHVPRKNIKTA